MLHPNKYWTLTSNIILRRNHVNRKNDWINNNCLMYVIKFETTINTRCYVPRTLAHDHDHIADKFSDTLIRYFSAEISTADLRKNELNYGSIHFFL